MGISESKPFSHFVKFNNFKMLLKGKQKIVPIKSNVFGGPNDTKWSLLINPNEVCADTKERCLSLHLKFILQKRESVKAKFKFSLVNKSLMETKLSSEWSPIYLFRGADEDYKVRGQDFDHSMVRAYLLDNNLIIRCKVILQEECIESFHKTFSTITLSPFIHTITIHEVLEMIRSEVRLVRGPIFLGPKDTQWCLRVYPNGRVSEDKGHLSVFLEMLPIHTKEATLDFYSYVINDKRQETYGSLFEAWKLIPRNCDYTLGHRKYLSHEMLLNSSNDLLVDGNLTLRYYVCLLEVKGLAKAEFWDETNESISSKPCISSGHVRADIRGNEKQCFSLYHEEGGPSFELFKGLNFVPSTEDLLKHKYFTVTTVSFIELRTQEIRIKHEFFVVDEEGRVKIDEKLEPKTLRPDISQQERKRLFLDSDLTMFKDDNPYAFLNV